MWTNMCKVVAGVFIILQINLFLIPGCEAVRCFNCRGITNYDPNQCFNPTEAKTVIQECQKDEMCETRITMVDRLQDVIDRGCSSNCDNRKFVWTDEFQVYCCDGINVDLCNSARAIVTLSVTFTVVMGSITLVALQALVGYMY